MARAIAQAWHAQCLDRTRRTSSGQSDPGGNARQLDLQTSILIVLLWAVSAAAAPSLAAAQDNHPVLLKLAFSPDSKTLATTSGTWPTEESEQSEIFLWDLESRMVRLRVPVPGRVWDLTYSPDGKLIAAGFQSAHGEAESAHVKLFDASSGNERMTLDVGVKFGSLGFSESSRLMAVQARRDAGEWLVDLWDLETGKISRTLNIGERFALPLATEPLIVATSDPLGKLELWRVREGNRITMSEALQDTIKSSLAYYPACGMLAQGTLRSGPLRGEVRLFDVLTAQFERRIDMGGLGGVTTIAFSSDGTALAVATIGESLVTGPCHLTIWNPRGELRKSLGDQGRIIHMIAYSPNDKFLATTDEGGTIKLWDTASWESVRLQPASKVK